MIENIMFELEISTMQKIEKIKSHLITPVNYYNSIYSVQLPISYVYT